MMDMDGAIEFKDVRCKKRIMAVWTVNKSADRDSHGSAKASFGKKIQI